MYTFFILSYGIITLQIIRVAETESENQINQLSDFFGCQTEH